MTGFVWCVVGLKGIQHLLHMAWKLTGNAEIIFLGLLVMLTLRLVGLVNKCLKKRLWLEVSRWRRVLSNVPTFCDVASNVRLPVISIGRRIIISFNVLNKPGCVWYCCTDSPRKRCSASGQRSAKYQARQGTKLLQPLLLPALHLDPHWWCPNWHPQRHESRNIAIVIY